MEDAVTPSSRVSLASVSTTSLPSLPPASTPQRPRRKPVNREYYGTLSRDSDTRSFRTYATTSESKSVRGWRFRRWTGASVTSMGTTTSTTSRSSRMSVLQNFLYRITRFRAPSTSSSPSPSPSRVPTRMADNATLTRREYGSTVRNSRRPAGPRCLPGTDDAKDHDDQNALGASERRKVHDIALALQETLERFSGCLSAHPDTDASFGEVFQALSTLVTDLHTTLPGSARCCKSVGKKVEIRDPRTDADRIAEKPGCSRQSSSLTITGASDGTVKEATSEMHEKATGNLLEKTDSGIPASVTQHLEKHTKSSADDINDISELTTAGASEVSEAKSSEPGIAIDKPCEEAPVEEPKPEAILITETVVQDTDDSETPSAVIGVETT
ncbi:hypothetical protein BC832DRAFT_595684 [Gaertneriomyces semiglobifer]|nr:hypothetical protein BC832DRAFT_595684 [Gaertneriomyces semiglobifer]